MQAPPSTTSGYNYPQEESWETPWPEHMQFYYQGGMQCERDYSNVSALPEAVLMQAEDPDNLPGVSTDGVEVPPEWTEVTTVMMRNLPNCYTQLMLLQDIAASGFRATFDFLHLPIDQQTGANKGYAFINFVEPAYAWLFKQTYDDKSMMKNKSRKVVLVSPADLQGFEANHGHYMTARCSRGDPTCRPLFLREPTPEFVLRPYGKNGKREKKLVHSRGLGPNLGHLLQSSGSADPAPSQAPTVAKFCPYCGASTQPTYRFCQICGASLAEEED